MSWKKGYIIDCPLISSGYIYYLGSRSIYGPMLCYNLTTDIFREDS